jgi:hypothetical protein
LKAWYARREIRLYRRDTVLCEEEGTKARLQREVAELRNVVIREVDRVVVLRALLILMR